MTLRIILWMVLLALSAGIIIISIILYNRRLDRVARGEQRDAHSNMPEPRTTASVIYRAVLLVLVILIFLSAGTMKSQMDALQTNMASLQGRVNELSRELRALQSRLEEEKKLVSDYTWEVVETDLERGTATVKLSAFMREYTDETSGFFSIGGESVPFTVREDGVITAELSKSIFSDIGEVKIVIKDGEKSNARELDWIGPLYSSVLPVPYIEMHELSIRNTRIISGSYSVVIDRNFMDDIQVVNAVYITGGREIRTADITEKVLKGELISIDTDVKTEDYLILRVDLYTKSGFAIKERRFLDYTVPYNEDYIYWMTEEQLRIYDQNGTLLYTTDNAGFISIW